MEEDDEENDDDEDEEGDGPLPSIGEKDEDDPFWS
jgi:hypothetical protein